MSSKLDCADLTFGKCMDVGELRFITECGKLDKLPNTSILLQQNSVGLHDLHKYTSFRVGLNILIRLNAIPVVGPNAKRMRIIIGGYIV
jgi:hypothetical protein